MASPLVSVIIPTYNRAKTIIETVNSVLYQSYRNFEVLVVDDGSEDNTADLIAEIPDRRLKYHLIDRSGRPAVPRNHGLSLARGDYIAFLDSDDLWLPDKLVSQVEMLESNQDIDVCYGYTASFGDTTERQILFRTKFPKSQSNKNFLLFGNKVPLMTTLFRRSFLEKNRLRFDQDLAVAEDFDFVLRSSASGGKFRLLEKILGHYRMHDVQLSKEIEKEFEALSTILNKEVIKVNTVGIIRYIAELSLKRRKQKFVRSYTERSSI